MTITSTRYEEVAQTLLDRFAEDFGLRSVEGKQDVPGNLTGTSWEIDAKGMLEGTDAFLIVECRRYTTSKLAQEDVAAIAYRIIDIGAAGAITVSPHDLQSGAKKVADANNIVHVRLSPESTPEEFQLQFLDKIRVGFHDEVRIKPTDHLKITITKGDGTSWTEEF
ncbi:MULTISPECIES: hypothetical protein [Burkholderia cepacia complex]|uniref:hypothetical protein n=1 Tax=Burkholderia cepacia complex TaxID=87882 RepID=UPI001CF5EAD3|nr:MULTISPECIES: hypothetical protein [Burkholderia cepacia complex]MCA8057136.1 hypothetical protein [Burkholderia cepacia]MDN7534673.1 hypothetical protein [Burkholderia orbicola]